MLANRFLCFLCSVPIPLETDPHCQLEGARSSRTENLCGSVRRLPKTGACQVSAVPHQVCFVEKVEHLSNQRQPPSLPESERAAQPQVERVEVGAKRVVIWEYQRRNRTTLSIL